MNISGLKTYGKFLARHKVYTFVSVVGFAISLTFVIILSFYAKTQMSMDSFHEKSDRLYLFTGDLITDSYNPMGDYFMGLCPEIEAYVRIYERQLPIGINGVKEQYMGLVMIADPGFFDFFTFPLLDGRPDDALSERNSVVISEQTALRLFGTTDALGKIVSVDGGDYSVSGVIKKFPYNTHFVEPDVIINYSNLDRFYSNGEQIFSDYNHAHFTFYFLEREGSDLRSKTGMLQEYLARDFEDYGDMYGQIAFMPVQDIYFSDVRTDLHYKKGSLSTTRVYIGVVLLILVIALLNYINMTVAQSGFRAREAAMKKLLGSGRAAIIKQVIAETFVMTFIAFIIAMSLALVVEGYAERMLDARLDLRHSFTTGTVAFAVGALLVLTVLAGIIPSIVLSSFSPLEVLKGTFKRKVKAGYSRALIIFQFAVCCGLLICTFVMYNQTSFMSKRDLGFNKDDILILKYPGLQSNQLDAARQRLLQVPGVEAVGYGRGGPIQGAANNSYEIEEGRREWIRTISGDPEYFRIFGLSFQPTSVQHGPGGEVVYLNRTALNLVNPDPQIMRFTAVNTGQDAAIGGILNDFNIYSLHRELDPVMFTYLTEDEYVTMIVVKLASGNIYKTAQDVREAFLAFSGKDTIDTVLSNDEIEQWYAGERRISGIMGAFTLLSLVIMVMGVFAMSLYMIRQKEKEIGIRKVSGATVGEVLRMLNRQSLTRVAIAYLIACPIAYYGISRWLENFPYRVQPGACTFILAGLLITFFCLVSVTWQSMVAARANPIESLKSE